MLRFNGWLGIVLLAATGYAIAEDQTYKGQNLLQGGADVLGQPLVYPSGTPRITSDIITLAPGEAGKPHIHQIPMFAYVLSGMISVDYGDYGLRTYQQGEALLEAQHVVHFGFKKGDRFILESQGWQNLSCKGVSRRALIHTAAGFPLQL